MGIEYIHFLPYLKHFDFNPCTKFLVTNPEIAPMFRGANDALTRCILQFKRPSFSQSYPDDQELEYLLIGLEKLKEHGYQFTVQDANVAAGNEHYAYSLTAFIFPFIAEELGVALSDENIKEFISKQNVN